MNTLILSLRQTKYELIMFRRNPAAVFFTFVFPLMFLVIFNVVFGDQDIDVPGGQIDTSTFYVPGIVGLSVISACYTNVAMNISFSRDRGLLKRIKGTPLPAVAFFAGKILQATIVSVILVVLVLVVGIVLYGVDPPADRMPAFFLALLVGAVSFCALGLAITSVIPNADAAPAVVNASILPLLFISNIFIPTSNAPGWLNDFASVFPVAHFASALHRAFDPFVTGSGLDFKDLAVMAAWGIAGVVVAVRYFTWEPKR
ncbi:MAG: ABC transporter permease [Dehalococcoidia bacterium]